MSRFGLRSCADSFKLSQNDKNNSKISKLQKSAKTLSKNGQSKHNSSSVVIEKESSNPSTMTDLTTAKTYEYISPISIVCSLPLQKISGILEKINHKQFGINDLEKDYTTTGIKIMCLYCDKNFASYTIQKKHVEKIHTLTKDRRCSSRNSNVQLAHESKQQTPQKFNQTLRHFTGCNYCKNLKGHIAASEKDLMLLFFHLVECHSDKYFGCKLCVLRFQTDEKLLQHMQCLHNKFSVLENVKPNDEVYSDVTNNVAVYKLWKTPHIHKSISGQSSISSLPQNITLSSINCSDAIKNNMFSRDEPILSRLGVAQNRLPNNRKGLRLRRDAILPDILLKSDQSTCSKIRNKIGKSLQIGEYSDVIFRVPTRTDMSCIFDDDFYEKVVSNVRNNLLFHLDGKIVGNLSLQNAVINVKQSFHQKRSTLVKSPIVLSCEIHAATSISSATAFPTLLTAEQYGGDVTSTKIKRSITKHSWKWKWDSFKKFKLINEGGKIVKKVKQPILCLRDLSKLDMWTQLTMRQKNELQFRSDATFSSSNSTSYCKKEKQILNNQLNSILDTRLLPHIILEQSEQTLIKLECENDFDSLYEMENITNSSQIYDEGYFSFLNLLPSYINNNQKQIIILSGEWARPRCYLCMGCGSNFEKLKSLEEHKMFRHTHVYATHYEIVGRELISSNLLRHFFIPKKALNRYENSSNSGIQRNNVLSKTEIASENVSNESPEDESSDSIQSILNSSSTTFSSKHSIDDCDTDTKIISHLNASSPTHSMHSASTIASAQITNQTKPNKGLHLYYNCTKCNRKCNGVLDLYRHMLDCSGDQIWNLAKKRKYRYYCGSKKRRQYNKYSNIDVKKKKKKSLKANAYLTDVNDPRYSKTKTPPRQRPSDAESIKKMLENLPPKRVCKKIIPSLNKTKKTKLLVKRKIFNSQALKQRRSKSVNQLKPLPKAKILISNSLLIDENPIGHKGNLINFKEKSFEAELHDKNTTQYCEKISTQKITEIKQNTESKFTNIKKVEQSMQAHASINDTLSVSTTTLLKTNDESSLKNYDKPSNEDSTKLNIQPPINECQINDSLMKKYCSTNDVTFPNSFSKNCEKKRSKKINDCIAMLTGKLEQKLKTETHTECKTANCNEQDKTTSLLNVNKTAKRKTCSRRIVKIDFSSKSADLAKQTEELPDNVPHYNIYKYPSSEKTNSALNYTSFPLDICPVTASTTSDKQSIDINLSIFSEIPMDINASNSNEIARNGYYNKLYGLQPVSSNSSVISLIPSFPQNSTVLPLARQNIPTRRQTICGTDGTNFSSILDNEIEPLDLSRKTSLQSQTANKEMLMNSGNKNQNSQSQQRLSSQILQSKQFYSNLDLLKIPQVKNPLCLNKIDEKSFCQKNTSRRKNCTKIPCEIINKFPAPTTGTNNDKELLLNKKESFYKCKNTLKMDEVVINHIDDAINSVINAEKEQVTCKDAKDSSQALNEKKSDNDLKKTDENVNSELSYQNKDELKSDKMQHEGLKRSVRSKTIDFIPPDITDIFRSTITPIKNFEEKLSLSKDFYNSQEMNISQKVHNPKEESKLHENKVIENVYAIHKVDSVESSFSNREIKSFQANHNNQTKKKLNSMSIPCSALTKKINENTEVEDFMKIDNLTAECTPFLKQCKSVEKCANIKEPEVVLNPIKKPRRRRKNELAAIVADQLLESFKIDKARRDNLKRLENLAYEKSEDLLLTGMLLMSSTKRNAASSHFNTTNDKFCNRNPAKNNKIKKKPLNCTDASKSIEHSTKTTNDFVETEVDFKICKKKQFKRFGKSSENDNINKLKTSLESFSFDLDPIKQNSDNGAKSETIFSETEVNPCSITTSIISKNSTILRPSILSITLESSNISKTQANDGKTIVSSRDPRLNKNIHKEENKLDYKCLLSRQRLRSANNADQISKRVEDDIEEDIYLTEITKNVNQKIMSENEDFIFANDEFEVGSLLQEDSTNKFYRPSTSMSVRSAPNLNEDRSNFDSMDENTNTEIIDMDLDDNLSVYTSFSQDVGRGRGRRRRRRRSILFSRKPKRKCNRDVIEEIFECELCKKTFYAASSLTKHQQTLAHVSKVSEQEYLLSKSNKDKNDVAHISKVSEQQYLLSKSNNDINNVTQSLSCDKQQTVEKISPLLKKNNIIEIGTIRGIGNNSFECINDKSNFNSFSRLTLNPDERLFFECCNILKGSQTSRTNDVVSTNNSMKYSTHEYQEKNETSKVSCKKVNNRLSLPFSKQTSSEKPKNEMYSQTVFKDQPIISTKSNKIEDTYAANDQNNSIYSHMSAVTNTTSRFKTKAAMKGYENITSDFNIHKELETKSRTACKLTALAEIALGNENTNSHDLALEQRVSSSFVQLNASECINLTLSDNPKNVNIYDNKKYQKNNDSQSTTSSKTIMHVSIVAADGQETDKIIIPERPFKNIGLEEKETIKFQKPKSTVNLLNTDDNSVSTVSYSDRDDFDFGSISCDDDISVRNSISKVEKNNCSNSSSRATTKTFENKSLIMGRIFKNVTAKKKLNQLKAKINSVQNDPLPPRADLNQIFDELRGNTISKGLDIGNKKVFDTVFSDVVKDDQIKHSSNITKTSTRKTKKNTKIKLTEKRGRNFTKLQSELGMSPDELAKLIDEGQRKSKRRCATNRPKKLIEMWSSDEYEEFLSTKDIFALIEEKEMEEKNKKKKYSTTGLNNIEDKYSSAIESTKICTLKKNSRLNDEGTNKRPLLQRKISQRKEVEPNQNFKLRKKKTTDIGVLSKISKTKDRDSLLENFKKRSKVNKPNGDELKSSKKEAMSKTINKSNSSKNAKVKKKSQTTLSIPRRKRVASEKLYYWSSSSDEDFGKICTTNDQNFESGEQYQKHGWIVGDSHKKLVTLLAIAKGNKKVDKCSVKKETSKKKSLSK